MKKNCPLALLLLLLGAGLSAQQTSVPIIKEIDFPNLINVSQSQLRSVFRPYIGAPYTNKQITELTDRLYALEYFNLVTVSTESLDQRNIKLIISVEERPKIDKISYQGASASFLNQLRDKVLINSVNDYYVEGMLEREEQNILAFYREKGYTEAKVEGQVAPSAKSENSVAVTFKIQEGTRLRVRKVLYEGNQSLSDAQIRAIPGLKLTGPALLFKSEYNGQAIEEDKNTIELFYKKKGFLDFKITDVRQEIVEEKTPQQGSATRYINLIFVLNEGQPYTLQGVTISGNVLYTTEELQALFTQAPGTTFDYLRFQKNFESLRSLYYDIGYVNNTIEYQEQRDASQNTVAYEIQIVERSRALVESIFVSGNETTDEDIILREIPLKIGDVFSRQELLRGVQNLLYLEIFSSVVPDVQPGSAPGLIQIVIKVEEKFTLGVNMKLGFNPVSSDSQSAAAFPFTAGAEISDRNFLGRNYLAGIQGEVSFTQQNAGINFYNPRLLGSRWSIGGGLSYTHSGFLAIEQDLDGNGVPDPYLSNREYLNSNTQTLADNFTLYGGYAENHTFNSNVSLAYTWLLPVGLKLGRLQLRNSYSTQLSYLDYDQNIVRPLDPRQRSGYRRFLYGDVFGIRLAFDTRDLPSNPLSGVMISQNFSLGGLLPTDFNRYYLSSRSRFDAHLPIIDLPVSDEWSFTWGFSFHTGLSILMENPFQPSPLNARENGYPISSFSIGRGWNPDYGELLWDNTITVSWLLVRQIVNFEFFFDAIGLWREKRQIETFSIDDLRFSLGFGPRLVIPQLPLGLYIIKLFRFDNGRLDSTPEVGTLGQGWSLALHIKLDPY